MFVFVSSAENYTTVVYPGMQVYPESFKMLEFEYYCSRNVEISEKMLEVGGHAEILVMSLETSLIFKSTTRCLLLTENAYISVKMLGSSLKCFDVSENADILEEMLKISRNA